MSPLATFCFFLGLALGLWVISHVRDWPRPQLFARKKIRPEDVRIYEDVPLSSELLKHYQSEIVHAAMKAKPSGAKAGFQRGHR